MRPIIVVTELAQVPPEQRWNKIVAPLQDQLVSGGLGKVLDFDALERDTTTRGLCEVSEVALELNQFDYGREVVDRLLSGIGLSQATPVMPKRWAPFHCDEYFESNWTQSGYVDEDCPLIWVASEIYEDRDRQMLAIGSPLVDGISFCYRWKQRGLWAHYPIGNEFLPKAKTLVELVDGWCSGELHV